MLGLHSLLECEKGEGGRTTNSKFSTVPSSLYNNTHVCPYVQLISLHMKLPVGGTSRVPLWLSCEGKGV